MRIIEHFESNAASHFSGWFIFVFRTIVLEQGQGPDQGAIHAEVFLRQQIGRSGLLQYRSKELGGGCSWARSSFSGGIKSRPGSA